MGSIPFAGAMSYKTFWVLTQHRGKLHVLGMNPHGFFLRCTDDSGVEVDGYDVPEKDVEFTLDVLREYGIPVRNVR